MALHRDIHWVGKQWAVTGAGMQVIDQKRKSTFDIDILRLWEDGLLESLSAETWLDGDDFARGLAVARARYPKPHAKEEPAVRRLSEISPAAVLPKAKKLPVEFRMKIRGVRAKFLFAWRIRARK